jgi:glycosyltransferase involved in cell wall biosynthesis
MSAILQVRGAIKMSSIYSLRKSYNNLLLPNAKPNRTSVLLITHYSSLYGANLSLVNIAEKMVQIGMQIHVICPAYGDLTNELRDKSIKFAVVPFKTDLLSLRGGKLKTFLRKYKLLFQNFVTNWRAPSIIAKYIIDNEISIVHTNSICTTIGAQAAYISKRPHVWHIRECLEIFYKDTVPLTSTRKKMYTYTNTFISISQAVKNYDSYKVLPSEKVKVIYNGLPNYNESNCSKPNDRFIFAIVGVLQPGKRVEDAIKAFALVQNRLSIKAELWVIGGTYPDNDKSELYKLHNIANELNVSDKIKFWGYVKDINPILNQAHCGLLCSVFESFGRVLVEYMQHRMFVIANDTGASREIVTDNVTGMIYKRGSVEDLA